jgi:hypothetical protein
VSPDIVETGNGFTVILYVTFADSAPASAHAPVADADKVNSTVFPPSAMSDI